MHGDIALCEAFHSAEVFYNLVRLGVPFPFNRFGNYVGYKTDHDPKGRGTSAGPLTSQLMFQKMTSYVQKNNVLIYDNFEIISLLTEGESDKKVIGAIALDKNNLNSSTFGLVVFNAVNVILGTGGPAGIYKTSVYPKSQIGSHGLALKIGAIAHNLTESQYGLASTKFRWNLSGSYQQVLPRYISTDQDGGDEIEFLNDYFPDIKTLTKAIFLKGYQWPFDSAKIDNYGSSLIDLLVHQEILKNRRVFLDFTKNISGNEKIGEFELKKIPEEVYNYLSNSGALDETPINRLKKLNQPAIDLYSSKNINISNEYLEIAVCVQHNNGGLKGNIWWESNIKHLFPVGEVNGTHGVKRPGGSSLNAGQVGSRRAALYISKRYSNNPKSVDEFSYICKTQIQEIFDICKQSICQNGNSNEVNTQQRLEIQNRISNYGAHIRNKENVKKVLSDAQHLYKNMKSEISIPSAQHLPYLFKNIDLCLTHIFYLEAIHEYIKLGGESRGSFIVTKEKGITPAPHLNNTINYSIEESNTFTSNNILELRLDRDGNIKKEWVQIHPIPETDTWFEKVWKDFRNDKIIE